MLARTPRLVLYAATAATAAAELDGPAALADRLEAVVDAWPPPLHDDHSMSHFRDYLEEHPDHRGWALWYVMLEGNPPRVVGTAGFKGAPDAGCVEIGYSMLPEHQGRGYASEAVDGLLAWAFGQDVESVIAHTYPELAPSIRVLEKTGFAADGPGNEAGTVRYRLTRGAWEGGGRR